MESTHAHLWEWHHMEMINIIGNDIYIKNDIFPHGRRPQLQEQYEKRFLTYLHYPGQRFTSYYTVKWDWMLRTNNSKNYVMHFEMRNLDVIRHRLKLQQRCLEDWKTMINTLWTISCWKPNATHLIGIQPLICLYAPIQHKWVNLEHNPQQTR